MNFKGHYRSFQTYFWVFYNDQPPYDDHKANEGHTKGIVVGDIKGGFWLIHSVPQFPQVTVESFAYKYPLTGKKYGQSFLCISMNATNIEHVGEN